MVRCGEKAQENKVRTHDEKRLRNTCLKCGLKVLSASRLFHVSQIEKKICYMLDNLCSVMLHRAVDHEFIANK